jgi:hypothetical protein
MTSLWNLIKKLLIDSKFVKGTQTDRQNGDLSVLNKVGENMA